MSDRRKVKKPLNIIADPEVVQGLKDANVNISEVCNTAMKEAYKEIRAQQWLEENQQAIADLHVFYQKHGSFAEKMRAYLNEAV